MMKYQDIHTTDSTLWKQYQDHMAKGKYDAAKAILAQTQLDNKRIDASLFNTVTTELTRLQNQGKDSTWSKNTMKVTSSARPGIQAGECYCRLNRDITPLHVTITGMDDMPEVLMQNSNEEPQMVKVASAKITIGGKEITRDGVYEVFSYEKVLMENIKIATVCPRYGAARSGTAKFIFKNDTWMNDYNSFDDWSLTEENTYTVAVNGTYMRGLQYSPFAAPYLLGVGSNMPVNVSISGMWNMKIAFSYNQSSDGTIDAQIKWDVDNIS